MRRASTEFDAWSATYDELLKDPVRDCFARRAEFFHLRKRDIVCDYFATKPRGMRELKYLDVGCGKGELTRLLEPEFGSVAGCDPSSGMLEAAQSPSPGVEFRLQSNPGIIPFEDNAVDFVTAVCVYHHVPPAERANLTREVRRVLKPNGVFALIEHNPWNPVTRFIVSRTPVDADAILLRPKETRHLLQEQDFDIDRECYFLYLPEVLYERCARLEAALSRLPLGGQYVIFGKKKSE
jgi:SAM-dependent methyltransferase